ncbi:MAG: polyhydroxyalkanoate synthesis repressor PhaR [Gammaproteobacteria bacterium]
MSEQSEKHIIKKYPNRRLYDTRISKYITLGDVKKLVLEGVSFCVIDVKTEEDLTRSILLQIIAEQEHDGQPIFNADMLSQLIRSYGDSYQSALSEYLEKSIELFASQQQAIQKNVQDAMTGNPLEKISELTEQNMQVWQQMQDNFFKSFTARPDKDKEEE